MANSKTTKPTILGRVQGFNIAFNGKAIILLEGKKQYSDLKFRNKDDATTVACNIKSIREMNAAIVDVKDAKHMPKHKKDEYTKGYESLIRNLEKVNKELVM